MHQMTPEERDAFQAWQLEFAPAQCVVCGAPDSWTARLQVAFVPDYNLETESIEQGMSVVVLMCRRCGLLLHFNADTVLGKP